TCRDILPSSVIHCLQVASAAPQAFGQSVFFTPNSLSVVFRSIHTQGPKRTELFEPGASEPIESIEKEYVLTISFGDQEIMLVTGNQYTCISKRRIIGFQRYENEELRVKLPADRDIAIGDKPNVDEASIY